MFEKIRTRVRSAYRGPGVARPGGPESSLFCSGLRASGRGLTLEFLLWHGVDMYIEQLTHEDFTQTTRSAPVTAATTWTFLHRSRPCTGVVQKHVLRCMSRDSRALGTIPRYCPCMTMTHTVPDTCMSRRSHRLLSSSLTRSTPARR